MKARLPQAGLSLTPSRFYLISALFGLFIMFILFIIGAPLLVILGLPFAAMFGLPRWIISFLIKRRQGKFLNEFPNALDLITRSLRSGLPLNDSVRLVAAEAREPVRTEFRRVVEAQQVGLSMSDACARMLNHMPLQEVNFFSIVIAVQAQAGGNLSEALGNLSRVLRERKKMKAKVRHCRWRQSLRRHHWRFALRRHDARLYDVAAIYDGPIYRSARTPDPDWRRHLDVHRHFHHAQYDQFRDLSGGAAKPMSDLAANLTDPGTILAVVVAVVVFATFYTIALPMLERGDLNKRMKAVSTEREQIRARERARLNVDGGKATLRNQNNHNVRQIVERFNLRNALVDANTINRLRAAGLRSENALNMFLVARFCCRSCFSLSLCSWFSFSVISKAGRCRSVSSA